MSRYAIGIGIRKYGDLAELPGAVSGAQDFTDWATSQGYKSKLLVDEFGPVTLDQVFKAVKEALETEPDRLLIFFAGHGASAGQGDYWLLSDWEKDANQVINLNFSITHAKRHPVSQIAFFADACRSPTSEAAYLLGATIFPSSTKQPVSLPQIDLFQSTRLGQIAQEVQPKTGEAFGVFTKLLLSALRCKERGATEERDGQHHVTSQALGHWLNETIPMESGKLPGGIVQMPEIQPTWYPQDNFYAVWPPAPILNETRDVVRSRKLQSEKLGRDTARSESEKAEARLEAMTRQVGEMMRPERPSVEERAPVELSEVAYFTHRITGWEERPGVLMLQPTEGEGLAVIRIGNNRVIFNTYRHLAVRLMFDRDRMLLIQYLPLGDRPQNAAPRDRDLGLEEYARIVAKAWLGVRLADDEVNAIQRCYGRTPPRDPAQEALLSYHFASMVGTAGLPWEQHRRSSLDGLLMWPLDQALEAGNQVPHLTRSWAYLPDDESFEQMRALRAGLVNSLWTTIRADFEPQLRRLVEGARS